MLLAAVMHATWNALVKTGRDRLVMQTLVILVPSIPAMIALPFLPAMEWDAVPYLAGSTLLHFLYYTCLVGAYRVGDLSQVYPIARGSAPVLVAVGAWLLAGETKTPLEIAGILVVSLGIVSLAWRPGPLRLPSVREDEALLLAFATGLTIAGYSVADGMGGRESGFVFTYIAWLFATEGPPLLLFALWRRRGRVRESFAPNILPGIIGGAVAGTAYAIVIWAMSVAPLAHVVALRETSVLIAAGIGALLLKESFGKQRIAAAAVVVGGAALLHLA